MRTIFHARLQLSASGVAFGLMAVLARQLTQGAGAFTAGQLSIIRFAVGVLASLLIFYARPGWYQARDYRPLILRGLSGGLVVLFYFLALSRIPAGEAGIVYNLYPILATVMSIFIFRSRPTLRLALGLGLATLGVALVLGGGELRLNLGTGELFALIAAVFAAASSNMIRLMRGTNNSLTIFFWFCAAALPVVAPFGFSPWPHSLLLWAGAIGLGLCALAGQLLLTQAYGALSVPEAAVWLQLTPVAQFLLAWPLLGETPTWVGFFGVLLATAGVVWASVRTAERR